jgi:uncharacterized repeat protein (TIGR02543 family)
LHTVTVQEPAIPPADFPAAPSRSGYTFTGWNTRPDGSGSPFTSSTAVNGDITVYAQWREGPPGSFTVSFALNDGTAAVQGKKIAAPPAYTIGAENFPGNPARDGFSFAGWNTRADGSGSPFTASTPVSGDTTVYAQWQEVPPGSFTVTFLLNDGTTGIWTLTTVTAPAITDFPGNPGRPGFIFGGWNTKDDGSGTPFTASTGVKADITVYAQWTAEEPGSYTVAFMMNDGTAAVLAVKTAAQGAPLGTGNFPGSPSRGGYNFGGWNTAADGSGTPFTSSTALSADISVYALWTVSSGSGSGGSQQPSSYTVTFKLNDGTETVLDAKTVSGGSSISAGNFPANPSRGGYLFGGWNTQPNGSGAAFTSSTAVSASITVYAQWSETGVITINLEDAGAGAFNDTAFILSKGGTPNNRTLSVTGSGYSNPRWFVDGVLKETVDSITIAAADYGAGGHSLSLLVTKNGLTWSKDITFTVTE